MRNITPGIVCAGFALLLAACGGGSGENPAPRPPPAANVAPTANAGTAQTASAGVTVSLNGAASTDSDGTIAAYAWTQTAGPGVTLSNAAIALPTFTAPVVATATAFTFSLIVTDNAGAASAASTVTITVNPPLPGTANVTGRVTFGRVPFSASAPNGLNYGSPVQQPSRGVTVRALPAGGGAALATATTDANGDYTLSVASNTSITIEVVAQLVRTGAAPTWNVRVANGAAAATYSYTDPAATAFNSSAGTPRNIAIPTGINGSGTATGTRASGPFAALDTIYQGMQTILGVAPAANFPDLVVDWGSQTAGTFFDSNAPQRIALLADLSADTDEFDQHVVAHEFGHYIEQNFSRADNIGGAHAVGDKLDPRVAFGEGFGYAFAAIVLNDPVARDSFVQGGNQVAGTFNIETNPSTAGPGVPAGNFGSWASESSVWSILWDIYDSVADANDGVSLGFAPIWQVLAGEQRTTSAFTTLFSFISELKVGRTAGELTALNTLVTAQNVVSSSITPFATTETNVPSPLQASDILPVYANITVGGAAVQVRSVDDEGATYNALGNRHFLRFTPATSGNVTVTVTTSNPATDADPDFIAYRAGSVIAIAESGVVGSETRTFPVVAGQVHLLDVYECSNGCTSAQGTTGDYTLTVTIN